MNRIENYNLPEHTNKLYVNESMSSIGLTHEIAKKINELVDAYNALSKEDLEWKQTQEGKIHKGVIFMKDNLLNSLNEILKLFIDGGEFSDLVSNVLGEDYRKIMEFIEYMDFVTPQMFGAIGDGVQDDTKAIQKALSYAETHKSHTVKFPPGVYRVGGDGSIFKSKFVSLVGEGATILVTKGSANTDLFTFTGTSNNYNGVIKGLKFDYASKNYTMINNVFRFNFEKLSDILYGLDISGCWFGKNKGYKIYTEGFSNGGFNNCRFNNNIVYGLFMKSLSFGDSNKICGNSLYGSEEIELHDYVINLTQTSGSSGCVVSENNCTSGLGLFNNFQNLTMIGNQVENTTQTTLDFLIKLVGGGCVTIDTCNLNAHYYSGLVYSNVIDTHIRNCSWYGAKPGFYALNNNNAHITILEGVRYFDGTSIHNMIPGTMVNGWATNVLYNTDQMSMYIDSALNMHIKPKTTGSFTFAPLFVECASGEVYIPAECVDGNVKCIKVTNNTWVRTEELLNVYASLPVRYF